MKPLNYQSILKVISTYMILGVSLFCVVSVQAQQSQKTSLSFSYADLTKEQIQEAKKDTVPLPRKVMLQSVFVPGWGQITNKQIWKVPIVYGLMGGLSYYAWHAHNQYSGYRAAFYNSDPENTDFRFGTTPSWINPDAPPQFYQTTRDFYRNRRDFLIVTVVLSYVLNFVDAYVYAHMRDFDVSDDLTSRVTLSPVADLAAGTPVGFRFNFRF